MQRKAKYNKMALGESFQIFASCAQYVQIHFATVSSAFRSILRFRRHTIYTRPLSAELTMGHDLLYRVEWNTSGTGIFVMFCNVR